VYFGEKIRGAASRGDHYQQEEGLP